MNNFQRSLALVGALLITALPVQAEQSGEGLSAAEVIAKLAPKKTRAIGVGTGGITKEQKGELEEILDPNRSIGLKERKKIAVIDKKPRCRVWIFRSTLLTIRLIFQKNPTPRSRFWARHWQAMLCPPQFSS